LLANQSEKIEPGLWRTMLCAINFMFNYLFTAFGDEDIFKNKHRFIFL